MSLLVPTLSRIFRDLHPVVLAILDIAGALQGLGEELSEVVVVRCILEAQVADVGEVLGELLGETLAEILDDGRLLLLTDLLVLLLIGSCLQSLPGESTSEEIHEDVAESLKVVSSGLLATEMGVDTHVSSSSREGFSLAVGDMLLGLGVTVLLGHAEIDDVNDTRGLSTRSADEEVVGLDVSVNEVLLMDGLDP